MGADLLVLSIAFRGRYGTRTLRTSISTEVAAAKARIEKLRTVPQALGDDEMDVETLKATLRDDLQQLKDGLNGKLREASWIPAGGLSLLVTGGLSWGDAPTEFWDPMSRLLQSGVIKDARG